MTNPTRAATIVFLAPSTPVLSPPDVIHFMPPKIKKPRAIKAAIIKAIVIRAPTSPPLKLSPQRALNCEPAGHGLTLFGIGSAASAGKAKDKYVAAVTERAVNFFITK